MALQKKAGRGDQSRLLASVDAGGGAAEALTASVTDLDENQNLVVAHDQIDFAVPATDIVRDMSQPAAFKIAAGEGLLVVANLSGVRAAVRAKAEHCSSRAGQ